MIELNRFETINITLREVLMALLDEVNTLRVMPTSLFLGFSNSKTKSIKQIVFMRANYPDLVRLLINFQSNIASIVFE